MLILNPLKQKKSGLVKTSIRVKLFVSFTSLMTLVLGLVFVFLIVLDSWRMAKDLKKVENNIRTTIINKGKQLSYNSSIAMRSLAEENSISSIKEIVTNSVDGDSDIVYGIYMNRENKPWAIKDRIHLNQETDIRNPLQDSMSRWSASIQGLEYRSLFHNGIEIIEFANPILTGGNKLGVIRFGLTTKSMNEAIQEAKLYSHIAHKQTFFLFLLIGFLSFLFSLLAATLMSTRMTQPITALKSSASKMAQGDYENPVAIVGTDEIAILAESFEGLRLKIKNYMHNLEDLVEAKVHQIRDILENIEQGLLTFNFDLKINEDSSKKAAVILGMKDLTDQSLVEILHLSLRDETLFRDWIEIVRKEHLIQRWSKLSRIAPIQEIQIKEKQGIRFVKLEYQRILDKEGVFSKIMLLARDVTETRKIERRLQDEKVSHEKTVKTMLGIAGHDPEIISDFLKDTQSRIQLTLHKIKTMQALPEKGQIEITNQIFKDAHTLKGNAGAFGFETLAIAAEDFENLLKDMLTHPEAIKLQIVAAHQLVETMSTEIENINVVAKLLAGNSEEVTVRLAESKILKIKQLAALIPKKSQSAEVSELVKNCQQINYRSLILSTKKYQELVARAAIKSEKIIDFLVSPENVEIDSNSLLKIDEALVHLLRNAVAHGIESETERTMLGKGRARIELTYSRNENGSQVFSITDNGQGINKDLVASKALSIGLITLDRLASLNDKEKLELIFSSGLSTSREVNFLAGRGLGLSIVADSLRAAGCNISLESRPGVGTTFTITIPV